MQMINTQFFNRIQQRKSKVRGIFISGNFWTFEKGLKSNVPVGPKKNKNFSNMQDFRESFERLHQHKFICYNRTSKMLLDQLRSGNICAQ